MKEFIGPLVLAVGCFVLVKVALAFSPLNGNANLLITTVAAAIIAGIFTRHVRARKGDGK